ncbi:hypothetical protein DFH11DRAFT_461888 [Phellopilus nigrolimitatus]|nr:hypothetical protein DFH11DRAFT_461888 [Phellopilus nigrolimitatus]
MLTTRELKLLVIVGVGLVLDGAFLELVLATRRFRRQSQTDAYSLWIIYSSSAIYPQPGALMRQYRLYDGNPLCANFGGFGKAGTRVRYLWVSGGSFASVCLTRPSSTSQNAASLSAATPSTYSAGDITAGNSCS